MLKISVLCISTLLTFSLPLAAATINVVVEEGVGQISQHGIRKNTSSYGGDLGGAIVTATFADGSDEEIFWNATSDFVGQAIGTGLSLERTWKGTETEQRFYLNTNKLLTSLSIDASGASSIFDISWWSEVETAGTYYGYPFTIFDGESLLDGLVTATYSNIFGIAGQGFRGDSYTTMTLDFSAVAAGGLFGSLKFDSDIDTLAVSGDLSAVPLSPSMPFLAFGTIGLFWFKRKIGRTSVL